MEAKELRVGNWLSRIDGTEFQVSIDDLKAISELQGSLYPTPIPLTEEWLVKFVFEKFNNQFRDFYLKKTISIVIIDGTFYFKGAFDEFNINVLHVHQLQNLYYALINEELIIK